MENFNKKDYKKLWVNFESSTQAMDLLVILNNIEIFEISLITIESDVNNNVLDLMDNLDWDVEVVFLKDFMSENDVVLSRFLGDFKNIDLLNFSNMKYLSEFFTENTEALESLDDIFMYDKYVKSENSDLNVLNGKSVFMITNDTFNKNDYTDILNEMFDESSEKLIEDLFLLYACSKKDHFIYAQTNLKIDEENNLIEGEGIETYISVTYNIDRFREFLESVII
ncbi:hypothetical protein [Finegoldia magna]|uniref:hypothetical protein n=1 Tax=Finegoldia magna TaxID=1260 RepID=UPI00290E1D29|nr:hypothetical protein [Finegoldia magna]MDU5508335.1 hypothetical protein [Finegoldia magna]